MLCSLAAFVGKGGQNYSSPWPQYHFFAAWLPWLKKLWDERTTYRWLRPQFKMEICGSVWITQPVKDGAQGEFALSERERLWVMYCSQVGKVLFPGKATNCRLGEFAAGSVGWRKLSPCLSQGKASDRELQRAIIAVNLRVEIVQRLRQGSQCIQPPHHSDILISDLSATHRRLMSKFCSISE